MGDCCFLALSLMFGNVDEKDNLRVTSKENVTKCKTNKTLI